MTETLANGYSSESTRCELSNEYQDDRVRLDDFQRFLSSCASDKSSLSIERVNHIISVSPLNHTHDSGEFSSAKVLFGKEIKEKNVWRQSHLL